MGGEEELAMATLNRVLSVEAAGEKEWIAGVWRKDWKELVELPECGFVNVDEEKLVNFLAKKLVFRERNEEVETDREFKQVIPYFVVVNQKGEVFSARRKTKGGDIRLHGKRIIGFGGHLRKEDIKGEMHKWLQRELEEELRLETVRSIGFFGLINDETEVGGVHIGLFFEVWVRGEVEVLEKEKMEEGQFYSASELVDLAGEMEVWSVVALKNL